MREEELVAAELRNKLLRQMGAEVIETRESSPETAIAIIQDMRRLIDAKPAEVIVDNDGSITPDHGRVVR